MKISKTEGYVAVLTILVVAAITIMAIALGRQHDTSVKLEQQTELLCDRGGIIADVIVGGIAVVEAERKDPNVPDGTHRADDVFIARFRRDLERLRQQASKPGSPCNTGRTNVTK